MNQATSDIHYVVCVRKDRYPASVELRKIYQTVPDDVAASHHMIRIIDESGEDYLYPEDYFLAIVLPLAVEQAFRKASG